MYIRASLSIMGERERQSGSYRDSTFVSLKSIDVSQVVLNLITCVLGKLVNTILFSSFMS